MTAAHPTIKTTSKGATIWGRAPAGGGGTISGSRRSCRAVLSQGGANAADGSMTVLKFATLTKNPELAAAAKTGSDESAAREVVRLILTSPEYQLA